MYSQLSNVAKNVVGPQQTAQIASSVQSQQVAVKQNENLTKVQNASGEKDVPNTVNPDGKNDNSNDKYQNQKSSSETHENKKKSTSSFPDKSSPYLGTIIDISR